MNKRANHYQERGRPRKENGFEKEKEGRNETKTKMKENQCGRIRRIERRKSKRRRNKE